MPTESYKGVNQEDPEVGNPDEEDSDYEAKDSDDDDDKEAKDKSLGDWQKNLRDLGKKQETVPEDSLHIVQWGAVVANFMCNVIALAAFVGFTFLAQASALLVLPLFMVTCPLGIVLTEVLHVQRIPLQVAVYVLLLASVGGGCLHFGSFEFVQMLVMYSFLPMSLVIAILWCAESNQRMLNGGLLSSSPLWQAMIGKKRVVVWEDTELAALAKAMRYNADQGTLSSWRLRLDSFLNTIGIRSSSPLHLGLVAIDDGSNEIPDIPLSIDDTEITPNVYSLLNLRGLRIDEEDRVTEVVVAPMEDFNRIVGKRKYISDKVLDTWLNPAASISATRASETAASGSADLAKSSAEHIIRQWVMDTKLEPRGHDAMLVTLERLDYMGGLMEHWAPRAAWSTLCCVLLALPTLHIFMQMNHRRNEACAVGSEHEGHPHGLRYVGDQVICDGSLPDGPESCHFVCGSLITFVSAIHDTWHTSYVELLLVFVLLPVFIFTNAVRHVRQQQIEDVLLYLRTIRQPKTAIYEVMRIKETFEDIFNLSFLARRFTGAFRAWLGSDDSLKACGYITDEEFNASATRGINDCLRQVVEPVSSLKSALACEKTDALPFGVGVVVEELPKGDDVPDIFEDDETADSAQEIKDAWEMLKFRNELGGASDRNYKVLVDLQIMSTASMKLFMNFLKSAEYKEQLEFITAKDNRGVPTQDLGKGAHLRKSTAINDILLPKGFSLTHIYVASMPEDGKPYQIVVQGSRKGPQRLKDEVKQLMHLIEIANVLGEEEPDEEETLLDLRLQNHPINARFALSEQYYENMPLDDIKELCPDDFKNLIKKPSFTEFVDACFKPTRFVEKTSFEGVDQDELTEDEAEQTYFLSAISVFMGDENPLNALLAAAKRCWFAVTVYTQCIFLALLIPILRKISGGQLFPQPFLVWSIFNCICLWVLMVIFFNNFHVSKTRLSIINDCLQLLMQNTNKPAAVASPMPKKKRTAAAKKEDNKKPDDADLLGGLGSGGGYLSILGIGGEDATGGAAGGTAGAAVDGTAGGAAGGTAGGAAGGSVESNEQQTRAAEDLRKKKKEEEDTRPFDLVLSEVNRDYVPTDEFWTTEWQKKQNAVYNWHLTVSYMRVFVSTSRLTAQTMLAAAVVLLAFLCLMSAAQAATHASSGVTSLAASHSRLLLSTYADEGQLGARRLGSNVEDALSMLAGERAAARPVSVEDAADGISSPSLASQRLRERLAPAHSALHRALLRQGHALSEGQTQLQDWTSSPGMAESVIATYRRLRDEGEDPSSAKAKSASFMSAMDVTKATRTQIFTMAMLIFVMLYSVPLMWSIVLVNGHFDYHEDLLIKQQEQHRTMQSKREWKKAESAGEDPALELQVVDPGCTRYERVMSMAIKSSRKTRERFPLKLFGFVISFRLLATWVGMAGAPLISQASKMAPPVTMVACSWLEHSRLVHSMQKQVDQSHPELNMNVSLMVHENLCLPLKHFMTVAVKDNIVLHAHLAQKAADSASAHAAMSSAHTDRRLLAASDTPEAVAHDLDDSGGLFSEVLVPDLKRSVLEWWREHAGVHSEAKYVAAVTLLRDLAREGERLLATAPRSVLNTFQNHTKEHDAEAGFSSALALVNHQLEVALSDARGAGPRATAVPRGARRDAFEL